MYKITNIETGFIQYRNLQDLSNFIYYNDMNKYKVDEIKTFDLSEFIAQIAFVIMILTLVFGFFWYGLS